MQTFSYSYKVLISFSSPVRQHAFKFRCRPASNAWQRITDCTVSVSPEARLFGTADAFGNSVLCGYCHDSHTGLRLECSGRADLSDYRLPEPAHDMYRNPSPLATADAAIETWARSLPAAATPADTACALAEAVHDRLAYCPGCTSASTTAPEVFGLGRGVCQDFAHLMIAASRTLGMPARYVSGFVQGTGVSHAWVEVFAGDVWFGIDPTYNQLIAGGYIKLSHGRDASDCPLNRGVFIGSAMQTLNVEVIVNQI